MGVDMYLESSQNQANSATRVLQRQNAAYANLQEALRAFAFSSEGLSGIAYDSAKAYCSQLLIPLTRACILLNEAIDTATKSLPKTYTITVDSVSLREDDLHQKIAQANRHITYYQRLCNLEYYSDQPNYSFINSLNRQIAIQEEVRRQLEEKLRKLLAFHASSPNLFSSIESLYQAVNQGLSQARTSWNGETQTFVIPSRDDLMWVKQVNETWANRKTSFEKSIDEMSLAENTKQIDSKHIYNSIESSAKIINPIQFTIFGHDASIETKDMYKGYKEWMSILRKQKNNPVSFTRGTVFSRGGAQISDLKIFGKSIFDNNSAVGKLYSKLPSYQHGTIARDLGMMKENRTTFSSLTKVGKAFKVAGWIGTALDAASNFGTLEEKGYSNEQAAAMTVRKVSVDVVSSTAGSAVGRVAGAAIGQAILPIPGVGAAVGAVVGGIVGGAIGSWIGSAINNKLDEGIKPRKKGWSWPW
ncbi:glycine zipper domain-containing protein [Streptococcus plurextorum]|uniref:glycine zipper domain-containing protein n=1 Tax=Streptococcus plurextorum TaxID=456876 RepID=UPI00042A7D31|nr:glycine zipper domain-containing protein [Streptococcus plurextorum]